MRTRARASWTLWVALSLLGCQSSTGSSKSTVAGGELAVRENAADAIQFRVAPPAAVPRLLPVLEFSEQQQQPPLDLVKKVVDRTLPGQQVGPLAESELYRRYGLTAPATLWGAVDREHVKAWVDLKTGSVEIYPTLSRLKPFPDNPTVDFTAKAGEIAKDRQFIPLDDTKFKLLPEEQLLGMTLRKPENGPAEEVGPAQYLTYVSILRFVAGLPVEGPGSRAVLAFAGDGELEGVTRNWRAAKITRSIGVRIQGAQLQQRISAQLRRFQRPTEVDDIRVVYYDGNGRYLQPVFRFQARVADRDPSTREHPFFVTGYVPFGELLEPIPGLPRAQPGSSSTLPRAVPAAKPPSQPAPGQKQPIEPLPGPPTATHRVGRFLARGLGTQPNAFSLSADALWTALNATPAGPRFVNNTVVEAKQATFTGPPVPSAFNSVELALVESHGAPGRIFTNGTGSSPVPIDTLSLAGPSGALNDWIIHSCEVVGSKADAVNWDTPWWGVFQRVRNVVGYRTKIITSDLATTAYGECLGQLCPIVSSWLSKVMALSEYAIERSEPGSDGRQHPVGRPSTISVCDHDEDSVLTSYSAAARTTCLRGWWINDRR